MKFRIVVCIGLATFAVGCGDDGGTTTTSISGSDPTVTETPVETATEEPTPAAPETPSINTLVDGATRPGDAEEIGWAEGVVDYPGDCFRLYVSERDEEYAAAYLDRKAAECRRPRNSLAVLRLNDRSDGYDLVAYESLLALPFCPPARLPRAVIKELGACETPPGYRKCFVPPPDGFGVYEMAAKNLPCRAALRVAMTESRGGRPAGYACRRQSLGYELVDTACSKGARRVRFRTGG